MRRRQTFPGPRWFIKLGLDVVLWGGGDAGAGGGGGDDGYGDDGGGGDGYGDDGGRVLVIVMMYVLRCGGDD